MIINRAITDCFIVWLGRDGFQVNTATRFIGLFFTINEAETALERWINQHNCCPKIWFVSKDIPSLIPYRMKEYNDE